MKKIAFFVQHMLSGGVETSLLNLIKTYDRSEYDITVYVIKEQGEFMERARSIARVLPIPMSDEVRKSIPVGGAKIAARDAIGERKYFTALQYVMRHAMHKDDFAELSGIRLSVIPNLEEHYDIAVCYHIHSPFLLWYVAERVDAGEKAAFIHNDFSTTGYEIKRLQMYVKEYDRFHAVSSQLRDEFKSIFEGTDIAHRVDVRHNIVPVDEILEKSKAAEAGEFDSGRCNILTVGRLERRKGIDRAVEICAQLVKETDADFKWFIIGNGSERSNLLKEIRKNGLQDRFVLLGNIDNPYPYFASCDLYVQTSRHEGYVTTITEALVFKKPIVSSEFAGVHEQLDEVGYAYIAGPIDDDKTIGLMSEKIKNMIEGKVEK